MLRFLGTIAAIVAVVWVLSFFATGDLTEVDGRDATPIELPPLEPVARIAAPEADPAEDEARLAKAEPEQPKDGKKKGAKGVKEGKQRRPLTSGLFAS